MKIYSASLIDFFNVKCGFHLYKKTKQMKVAVIESTSIFLKARNNHALVAGKEKNSQIYIVK